MRMSQSGLIPKRGSAISICRARRNIAPTLAGYPPAEIWIIVNSYRLETTPAKLRRLTSVAERIKAYGRCNDNNSNATGAQEAPPLAPRHRLGIQHFDRPVGGCLLRWHQFGGI